MLTTLNGTENLEYDNAHSYASSAEEIDKLQDAELIELEMKRARPVNSYKMAEPPKPFTDPLSQYNNKDNSIYINPDLQKLFVMKN